MAIVVAVIGVHGVAEARKAKSAPRPATKASTTKAQKKPAGTKTTRPSERKEPPPERKAPPPERQTPEPQAPPVEPETPLVDAGAPPQTTEAESPQETSSAPRPELPRGGREIFPTHRLVGFCGTPGAPRLGRLTGNLALKSKALLAQADKYARGRKILPVFELIAVIVQADPGRDGKSRRRVPYSVVDEYLRAAREAKGLLLLNIQPGHSDFLTEAKHYEKYLREPDVGLALDPEWAMKGKQKPGVSFGRTSGAEINAVAAWLSSIVKSHDLPEKVLVFHQVNEYVVKDESAIVPHPGVVLIKSVDGLGPKAAKIKTYNVLVKSKPPSVHAGFKLFFDEDTANGKRLMTPDEVLALSPEPEYVMYE